MSIDIQPAILSALFLTSLKLSIGIILWFIAKPRNLDSTIPKDVARKWLAFVCLISPFAARPEADKILFLTNTTVGIVITGLIAYMLGYLFALMQNKRKNINQSDNAIQVASIHADFIKRFNPVSGSKNSNSTPANAFNKNTTETTDVGAVQSETKSDLNTLKYFPLVFIILAASFYSIRSYDFIVSQDYKKSNDHPIAFEEAESESTQIKTVDFKWSPHEGFQSFDKVVFTNGSYIQVSEGELPGVNLKFECEYKRVDVRDAKSNSLRFVSNACDSLVFIQAVYPTPEKAKLAIVSTNCGGTICREWSDYFVFYISKDNTIRVAQLGSGFYSPKENPTTYSFNFDSDYLTEAVITNFFDGTENQFGDKLSSTRIFVDQGEFVDNRFMKDFINLIGQHPDSALGNNKARERIINKITPERYRTFRASMSGPGFSEVVDGRYLVMNACMKSNCAWVFGTVVLDGFTGAMHIMRFEPDQNIFDFFSSEEKLKNDDSNWLAAVNTNERVRLSIESGILKAVKIR